MTTIDKIKTLEPLNLTQNRIAQITDDTRSQTWYAWTAKSGLIWNRHRGLCLCDYDPTYSCKVILPGILAGTPGDIQSDVLRALNRHAETLGVAYEGV